MIRIDIKCDTPELEVKGGKSLLLTELTLIIASLLEKTSVSLKEIKKSG